MKIRKIIFNHTIALSLEQTTSKVNYEIKEKSFSLFLDNAKQNHNTISNWLAEGTLYESDVSGVMCRLVKPGDMVVDVGANIGFHTFLLSELVEETGNVIAYEPGVKTIKELTANKELNKSLNVDVSQKLLSDKTGDVVDFHFSDEDSGTSYAVDVRDKAELQWEKMQTYRLDDELKVDHKIKLVKIDVEGYEGNILRGASNLLSNHTVKYWIVEYAPHCLARNGDNLETLRSFMAEFNLEMFLLDIQGGFPKLWPEGLAIHSRYISNLLFAKKDELATDWVIDDISKFVTLPKYW